MSLFKRIPENFFTLLTLENKELYAESLLVLWQEYKELHGELDKERSIIILITHFDKKLYELRKEFDEEIIDDAIDNLNIKNRANKIYKKLLYYGWIIEEDDPRKMETYVIIPSYSTRFIEAIKNIVLPQNDRTSNYAANVYLNMQKIGDKNDLDYLIFLESACMDTENLVNILNETFDIMKRYYDGLLKKASIDKVLKEHFEDYFEDIVEKRFHPLTTTQNIYKYRQTIIDKAIDLQYEHETILMIAKRLKMNKGIKNLSEAEDKVISMLNYIKTTFESIDGTRDRLKEVHRQYVTTTMQKINYMLNKDKDIKDNIYKFLKLYKENEKSIGEERSLDIISSNIYFNEIEIIGSRSLYSPKKARKLFDPGERKVNKETGQEQLSNKKRALEKGKKIKLSNPLYSEKTIISFIESMLGGKSEINTKEIRIKDEEDYIKLVLALNYTSKKGAKYSSRILENQVTSGIYQYQEIIFKRRVI